MKTIRRIISCLNAQEIDETIIKNTQILSEITDAELVIFVHVIKDIMIPDAVIKEFPQMKEKAFAERTEIVKESVKKYFKGKSEHEVIIRTGNDSREILGAIDDTQADLVILGRKKDAESVLSARISRRAPCNFLVIPEDYIIKLDKVIVPIDFSDHSILAFKHTVQLTKGLGTKIYLQHVYNVPSSYRYSGQSYDDFAKVIKRHADNDLNNIIKSVDVEDQEIHKILTKSDTSNVMGIILENAHKEGINLIIMGARGRTTASALLIGSKAERMVKINEEIPLLVVRRRGGIAGVIETLSGL